MACDGVHRKEDHKRRASDGIQTMRNDGMISHPMKWQEKHATACGEFSSDEIQAMKDDQIGS
jgi:hypothetical protein